MVDELPALLADLEADTRNVVLTLARMWTTSVTGDVRSKADAAAWVLERLPAAHRPVLEVARAGYLGDRLDRWDEHVEAARAYARFVADRIPPASALPPSDASV
jgi:streptomycin 3"-adenylyltransferase